MMKSGNTTIGSTISELKEMVNQPRMTRTQMVGFMYSVHDYFRLQTSFCKDGEERDYWAYVINSSNAKIVADEFSAILMENEILKSGLRNYIQRVKDLEIHNKYLETKLTLSQIDDTKEV